MINGAHAIVYSTNAEADRAFLREILELTCVDVGGGWLIFGLPPSEVAVHPGERNDVHELFLMCDDIEGFVATMKEHSIECSPRQNHRWGILTHLRLPGGGKLGVYEPHHDRPSQKIVRATRARASTRQAATKLVRGPLNTNSSAKKTAEKK